MSRGRRHLGWLSVAFLFGGTPAWSQESTPSDPPSSTETTSTNDTSDPADTRESPDAPSVEDDPARDEEATPREAEVEAAPSPAESAPEASAPAARQPLGRRLTGTVTDNETGAGLADVLVQIEGTTLLTTSLGDGTFFIEGAPPGPLVLQFMQEGYTPRTLNVVAQQSRVDAALIPASVEEIVVVGRGTQIAKKNLANSVSRVSFKQLEDVASENISQALQGKIAGANIQANSGAPGGGIQMQLRGVSSINGRSTPLYVIDGVIVSDLATPSGISTVSLSTGGSSSESTQDNQVNRIADINPYDIADIQVLKGASAAAIYGAKASNGVVVITTKRGRSGEPRVNVTQRFGLYTPLNTLGSRNFETLQEAIDTFANADDPASVGAITDLYTGQTFDNEGRLLRQRELSTETSVSLSGGSATTDYFASLLVKDDAGIIPQTGYKKQSGRLNVGQRFGENFELRMSSNLIHSDTSRSLTNNDNAGVSHYIVLPATPNFFDLRRRPDGSFPRNPFIASGTNPLQTVALMDDSEETWRMIGALNARWTAWSTDTHRLEALATTGVDWFEQKNLLLFPRELFFEPNDGLPGTSLNTTTEGLAINVDTNLVHTYEPISGDYKLTSSAGFQFEQRGFDNVYVTARNVASGQRNVDNAAQFGVVARREKIRDRGFYVQEEALLFDQTLTLNAGLRMEQSSVNGDVNQFFFFPKAAAAYQLPWLPDTFDNIKVRVAYGETGNQPLYDRKFTPLDARGNIGGNPALVGQGIIGDPEIAPERQREIEGGVDFSMFEQRLSVELTGYYRVISDFLLEREVAPSTGFDVQYFNGGSFRNMGLEALIQGTPIETSLFSWMSRATFFLNRSRVTDLPVPPFRAGGFRPSLGEFRIEEGKPVTQIVGFVDGECCFKIGDSEPDFRVGFYNELKYQRFTFSFLLDWQQGSDVINLTQLLSDSAGNTADFEEPDGGNFRISNFGRNTALYVQDATYVKLRELVVAYDMPPEWLEPLSIVSNLRFTLSGRNLLVFTPYEGLDPEVSNFGNRPVGRNVDVAPFPPSRSFWFSVSAGF